jgi:hypothetical protein
MEQITEGRATLVPGSNLRFDRHVRNCGALDGGMCGTKSMHTYTYNSPEEEVCTSCSGTRSFTSSGNIGSFT